MSHHTADDLGESSQPVTFMKDARHNLAAVRARYGRHSEAYRRLLRRYRAVASELGCRREFERQLHPLRRRAAAPGRRPRQASESNGAAL